MAIYYLVAGLKPGSEFIEDEYSLKVDISGAIHRPFSRSDANILLSQHRGEYTWVSGGGTYLLNNRYIPIVQRSKLASVNPGRFSLFTGRADSIEELLHPSLLIRELFEELILFNQNQLYKPFCTQVNSIINQVYAKLEVNLGLNLSLARLLKLEYLFCNPRMVCVMDQESRWEGMLDYHVSSAKEVNILFVLSGEVKIETLQALDGEYNVIDSNVVPQNRSIFLYDLHTGFGREITKSCVSVKSFAISTSVMTEHLNYLVNILKSTFASNFPIDSL